MTERFTTHNGHIPQGEPPAADTESSSEYAPLCEPRMYVACLAAYNNGYLHGVWLDAARQAEEIYNDIHAMLATSPIAGAEEWAIHDTQQFGPCTIHEHDSIELVSKIARGIKEHGYGYAAWADVHEGTPELLDHFAQAYIGQYDSLEAYVTARLEERDATTHLDQLIDASRLADLKGYIKIDTQALANDWYQAGDIHVYPTPEGGVYLFDERA